MFFNDLLFQIFFFLDHLTVNNLNQILDNHRDQNHFSRDATNQPTLGGGVTPLLVGPSLHIGLKRLF